MAWLGKIALVAGMLVLAFAQAVPAQRLLRGSDLSFAVLEATPQEMERLPAVDYHAGSKFPHYERLLDFEFKPSVKREEFGIGERLDLIFEPGRSGYVSIIDYCADGVARVILRNRAVQAGFRYSFGGEVSEPAGRDYLRAVLSSLPLSYASLKALCEFPFSHERQVNHVLQERWLAINVSGRYRSPYFSEGDDPFYDRPRTWYRHLGDEQYLYAQPYRGTVRARGLSVATRAQTYSDFT